jgi:DNA-binding LytR/AlgR family response regulator
MSNNKIRCLAVDDEPPALQVIEKYIAAIPSLQLVGTSNNAVDTLSILQNSQVDLIFLDIQMPQILGTDFIRTLINPPKVIFTTAYRKFALEGFELDAVDYLLKPISFERFLKAVNRVMKSGLVAAEPNIDDNTKKETPNTFIYLRSDKKNIKVHFEDILFIESLKDYIKVVTREKTIITKQSISVIEESLPRSIFVRIHRSFIVSIHNIDSFTTDLIQINKYELPVSRSYRHEVEKMLHK